MKKALRVTGGLLAVIAGVWLALEGVRLWESRQTVPVAEEPQGDLYYQDAWYSQRNDLQTVLLFGVDKYAGQMEKGVFTNDQQVDFFLLAIIDRKSNVCHAMPLNRDTMAKIARLDLNGGVIDTVTQQLALAHTYGSGGADSGYNTLRAVSDLLYGVSIDHYIGISMDAVPVLADAVGGVPVMVKQDFSSVTDELPLGEEVLLTGDNALRFVRARGGVGEQTNIERMSRQTQFMEAFLPAWKQKSAAEDGFLIRTMMDLSDYMTTDCTIDVLSALNDDLSSCEIRLLEAPAGESVKGEEFMEFYVDENALRQTVINLFYEKCE